MIKLRTYKHYKGNLYRVIGIAIHTQTEEEMVVYHPLGNPTKLYVRPVSEWDGMVDGVPRFQLIK